MTIPITYEVDVAGENLFERVLGVQLRWIVVKIPRDRDLFGVDFEVWIPVVTADGKKEPSESEFKAQLKSSCQSDYAKDGSYVRVRVKKKHLLHWRKLRTPMFLVHADITSERLFWASIHLAEFPAEKLGNKKEKTLVVEVPTDQELPVTSEALLVAIERSWDVIIVKSGSSTAAAAAKIVRNTNNSTHGELETERVALDPKDKQSQSIREVAEFFRDNDKPGLIELQEIKAKLMSVVDDNEIALKVRFFALLYAERTAAQIVAASSEGSTGKFSEVRMHYSRELRKLTQHAYGALKLYAMLNERSAEIGYAGSYILSLLMARKLLLEMMRMGESDRSFLLINLILQRKAELRLWSKFKQMVRLIQIARNSPYRAFLPKVMCAVCADLVGYLHVLDNDGRIDTAKQIRKTAFHICQIAASISERYDDADALTLICGTVASLNTEEYSEWGREMARRIIDPSQRRIALDFLERNLKRIRGEHVDGDYEARNDDELADQALLNVARSWGVDINNPNDYYARLIRQGIKDRKPADILRTCQFIHTSLGRSSPLEVLVRNTTTVPVGEKLIFCEKHKYGLSGHSLNPTFAEFDKKFCSSCPDKCPRPANWEFSFEQLEADRRRIAPLLHEFWNKGT